MPDNDDDSLNKFRDMVDSRRDKRQKETPSYWAHEYMVASNTSANQYLMNGDPNIAAPKDFSGIEDYSHKLSATIHKISGMEKNRQKNPMPFFPVTKEQALTQLSKDELSVLAAAPDYFQSLITQADEHARQVGFETADPAKRAKAVETVAEKKAAAADFRNQWDANIEHGGPGGIEIPAYPDLSKAKVTPEEFAAADKEVRQRPDDAKKRVEHLQSLAANVGKLNQTLGIGGRGSGMSL